MLRRIVISLVAVGLLAAAFSAALATQATATHSPETRNVWVSSQPDFKGWVTVKHRDWVSIMYPVERLETYPAVHAWKWNYPGWSETSVAHDTRVYAWPYGWGWSWAWTAQTGWLAMRQERLLIRQGRADCETTFGGCPIR